MGPALALQGSQGPLSRTGKLPGRAQRQDPSAGTIPVLGNPTLARTVPRALREQTDCYPPALCWPRHQQQHLHILAVLFCLAGLTALSTRPHPGRPLLTLSRIMGSEPLLHTCGCLRTRSLVLSLGSQGPNPTPDLSPSAPSQGLQCTPPPPPHLCHIPD